MHTLCRYTDMPPFSIGTLHADCRKVQCARKAVGEGVRCT